MSGYTVTLTDCEYDVLIAIVKLAAQLDMLLAENGGDVGDICETEDALHEALKPWRAAQCAALEMPDDVEDSPNADSGREPNKSGG